MTEPFVHSNFARREGDFYPTIDKRCTYGFLEYFNPLGTIIDPCAPSGSGIVKTLKELGYKAECLPDAFMDFSADWVITNPPYARGIVDNIINRQIQRIETKEISGLSILLRSNFDFAKGRTGMFQSSFYFGQIKLLFRPWWTDDRKAQPIHNYVWHVWTSSINIQKTVMYSKGRLEDLKRIKEAQ